MYDLLTLGGLALTDSGGRPVDALRGRNLALLALLARSGAAGMTRERLAAYLWPESDAERARHSLDQAVYRIRRALEEDPFVSGGAMLALDGAILDSDAAAFEGALQAGDPERAVERYGGAFLDGFHLSGTPGFERWVDGERATLQGRYTEALEALARAAAEAGDRARAVGYRTRLVACSPLSSRAALELMRALERAGDRARALQVARVHAARVEEELGTAPDAAVLEYAEALATPEPVRVAEPVAGSGSADGAPNDPPAEPRSTGVGAAGSVEEPSGSRSPWLAGGLAAALVLALAFATGRDRSPADPEARVAVASFTNETGDSGFAALGLMASDWITDALVRTGLVRVVRAGTGIEPPKSVVGGRIYRRGDSIWIRTEITDPGDGTVLRSLEAVGAPAGDPAAALEPLREEVLGAMGTLYDPRIAAWSGTALRPPSWPAYQEFAAGVELHAVPRDLPGAAEHFRRAAELDPGYTLPRLWLAWADLLMEDYAGADSVTRSLVPRRGEMSPLERAWHDRIRTLLDGDSEGTYRAARRMVQIASGSGWVISLASAALDTRRPSVAIEALEGTGIDHVGLEREHAWSILAAAYHMSGEHEGELAVAERAIERDGLDWGFVGAGVPVLAALGRLSALERRLEEVRGIPPAYGGPRGPVSALTAVTELRVHGFEAEADALAERLLARADLQADAAEAPPGPGWYRLQLLYESGRWARAGALLDAVRSDRRDIRLTAMSGLLAVREGDPARARELERGLAGIDRPYTGGEVTLWRARIRGALGDGEEALRLARQAFSEGVGSRGWHQIHTTRDFDGLRGGAGFRRLMGPRDAPAG